MDPFDYQNVLNLISKHYLLILFSVIFLFLYNYYTSPYGHFRKRGIPYLNPKIIIGDIAPWVFMKMSFHEFTIWIYNRFDGLPYGGI